MPLQTGNEPRSSCRFQQLDNLFQKSSRFSGFQSRQRGRDEGDPVDEHRRDVCDDRRHRLRHRQLQGKGQALHVAQQHDALRHGLGEVKHFQLFQHILKF